MKTQVLDKAAEESYDEDGNMVLGAEKFTATPALLAVAAKFLKDNSITCDIKNDENLTGLKVALSKKQKHSRLVDGSVAAKSMENMQ